MLALVNTFVTNNKKNIEIIKERKKTEAYKQNKIIQTKKMK